LLYDLLTGHILRHIALVAQPVANVQLALLAPDHQVVDAVVQEGQAQGRQLQNFAIKSSPECDPKSQTCFLLLEHAKLMASIGCCKLSTDQEQIRPSVEIVIRSWAFMEPTIFMQSTGWV
jgi:hypothetical protein